MLLAADFWDAYYQHEADVAAADDAREALALSRAFGLAYPDDITTDDPPFFR
jgi:hypothetical protein